MQTSSIQKAAQLARSSGYYLGKIPRVAEAAHQALDEYVGTAVNISNDDGTRNSSNHGRELSSRVGRGLRWSSRAANYEQGARKDISESLGLLDEALASSCEPQERDQIQMARSLLVRGADTRTERGLIEQTLDNLENRLPQHLSAVEADQAGKDVSSHGRPIIRLFENTLVSLDKLPGSLIDNVADIEQAVLILDRLTPQSVTD